MVFKNNRSNPRGKQKARPNSMQYIDPDPANIYIYMPSSFELSRSAPVHEVVGLLLCLLGEMNCSKEQGVMEGCRKCLDLHLDAFYGGYFPSSTFQNTMYQSFQYTLPKSCMWRCPTVQKLRWRRLLKACNNQFFDQCEEGGFPTGLSVHLPVPNSVTGFSNKLWGLGSYHVPFPHHSLAGLSLS